MPHPAVTSPPPVTVFRALSNETRMAVVERLGIGPSSATELSRTFTMALPSFMQHLSVLERSGVAASYKTGRTRIYQLTPDALHSSADWLSTVHSHWERRLDQLDRLLIAGRTDEGPTHE